MIDRLGYALKSFTKTNLASFYNRNVVLIPLANNYFRVINRFKSTNFKVLSQTSIEDVIDHTRSEPSAVSSPPLNRWDKQKKINIIKWKFLEHKGPLFAPPYERLPSNIKFTYDGKEMRLSLLAEEVATFYAKILHLEYKNKRIFNQNFFNDWRKIMTEEERAIIKDFGKCDFTNIYNYFVHLSEKNTNITKEQRSALKEQNERILEEYGHCIIDGHREKISNYKLEPPGLFRGRGEHPKMGKLKKRILPEDVIINCSKDSKIPTPPSGHKWKEVRHDPTVSWLAAWAESIQNKLKYVMLDPCSKLRSEMDCQKYELARCLHHYIDKIRTQYRKDWKSREMLIRQRGVALYFIDKLALRAGYEKDEDELDTVGCCSLRVEHIKLHETKDEKMFVVVFDFLGKDAVRYYNEVSVEKEVFDNLKIFMKRKHPADYLFDYLSAYLLNKHLSELMDGLTVKVFRTYNASWTFQQELNKLTNPDNSVSEKILAYNRANRAVAILCNHQCNVAKNYEKQMENIETKIKQNLEIVEELRFDLEKLAKNSGELDKKEAKNYKRKLRRFEKSKEALIKLEVQKTNKNENKTLALGTSKINYIDPRITVSWCKKYDVPIEKIYSKAQRDKFYWAIESTDSNYQF